MKCTNCGFENEQNHPFCPQCQAQMPPNTAAQTILRVVKDPLFLVICILMSVSALIGLSAGNIPVIEILLTVFLWLTYDQGRKDIADAKHLRCVSGTVYASYVIYYVSAGLVVLVGVIFAACFSFIANDPEFIDTVMSGIADEDISSIVQGLFHIPGTIMLIVFAFAAIIIVLINIFSMRYIHRFAQSVYQSIQSGTLQLKHVKTVKVWLFIFAGFSAVSCLSGLAENGMHAFLNAAVGCAINIIAGLLINKHLTADPPADQE